MAAFAAELRFIEPGQWRASQVLAGILCAGIARCLVGLCEVAAPSMSI